MLAAIRAIHFAAVLLLFGGFIFVVFVAWPTFRDAGSDIHGDEFAFHRWLLRVAAASLVVALVSGGLWLGLEAAEMSALSLQDAWQRNVVGTVLNETRFGQLGKVRFGIAAALAVLIPWGLRQAERRAWTTTAIGAALAGVLLATLALTGHAAAWSDAPSEAGEAETTRPPAAFVWVVYAIAPSALSGDFRITADAVHLLAAGAWIGAMPAFLFLLKRSTGAGGLTIAGAATRRFSAVGLICVACLIASGLANSWYLVGGVPGLLGTSYGRLLLLKLGLFALMLVLAAANRRRWMPMLIAKSSGDANDAPNALWRLKRNAGLEAALGFIVVSIVGVLGTTVPGAHEQSVWPFPWTLEWPQWSEISGLQFFLTTAGVAAAGVLIAVLRRSGVKKRAAIGWGIGAASLIVLSLGVVAAFPTTYFHSPVRYTATSIARGNALYTEHCASCHGPFGYGGGDEAADMNSAILDLTRHVPRHREGDVFWWVSNGVLNTPMPAFSATIDERGRWDIVNFLYAQADAERGKSMTGSIEPWQGIVAPDFTFEIEPGVQQTLSQQRERRSVLLVLFTYPESMPRLCILAKAKDKLERAGLVLLAVPMNRERMNLPPDDSTHEACLRSLLASAPDSDVIEAYTLFRRVPPRSVPPVAPHSEFLVDRHGYLRARWTAPLGYASDGTDELGAQVIRMNRLPPHPPAGERRPH